MLKYLREGLDQKSMAVRLSLAGLLALSFVFAGNPPGIHAGATDPVLAIGQVVIAPAGDASLARLSGSWEFDNILQVDFPLSLVVYQGTDFVRLTVDGDAVSGSFPGLVDGLQSGEISGLETAGGIEPDAALLRLDANEITVALPSSIVDGDVSFVAYVELPAEGTFISNTITTVLLGAGL